MSGMNVWHVEGYYLNKSRFEDDGDGYLTKAQAEELLKKYLSRKDVFVATIKSTYIMG